MIQLENLKPIPGPALFLLTTSSIDETECWKYQDLKQLSYLIK